MPWFICQNMENAAKSFCIFAIHMIYIKYIVILKLAFPVNRTDHPSCQNSPGRRMPLMNIYKHVNIKILLFFVNLIFGFVFVHSSIADQSEPLEIKAAVLKHFPPQYNLTENGEPAGFAIDVMNEIAEIADIRVEYLLKDNWEEVFESVKSGRADLIPNQGITEKRKEFFAFTSPVETFPVSIFVRKSTNDISGIADLAGRKVAVVKLNVAQTILKQKRDIILKSCDHIGDALFDLLSGNVDALAFPQPVLLKYAWQARIGNRIKIVGKPLIEIKRAVSVRKDKKELLNRLDAAVRQFIETKEYRDIYVKWYGMPEPFWTIRKMIILMSSGLFFTVLLMSLWRYRSLVKINKSLNMNIEERKKAEKALQESRDALERRVLERTKELSIVNQDLISEVKTRKQTEEQLREKEQFLATVFDSIQDGITVLDKDLTIVRVNRTIQKRFEHVGRLEGKKCFRIMRNKSQACNNCPSIHALETKMIEKRERQLEQPDGSILTMEIFAFPMIDDDGNAVGIIEYIRDITDRKQTEQAIKESEQLLTQIIEFLPDPTWVIDSEGKIIAWNKSMEKLTGVKAEDMLGKGNYEHSLPFYGKRRPSLIDLVLQWDNNWESGYISLKQIGDKLFVSESFHSGMKNGDIYLAGSAAPLYNTEGNIVGAIESVRNITDIKLAEKEKENLIEELQQALKQVKTLSGMLPICASCKKIRDDKGYWNQIEEYIRTHSEAEFSHGICPDCARKLYPELKIFDE